MKKTIKEELIIILVILILVSIIMTLHDIIQEKEPKEDLKGFLESGKPQNISIVVIDAPPAIILISPENTTYSTTDISLDYSIIKGDLIWYNLDNTENITITEPLTFTTSEGSHVLYLYVNNTEGTSVKNITFTVDLTQEPPPSNGGNSNGGNGGVPGTPPQEPETPIIGEENKTTKQETNKSQQETPGSTGYSKSTIIITLILIIIIIAIIILLSNKKLRKIIKTKLKISKNINILKNSKLFITVH